MLLPQVGLVARPCFRVAHHLQLARAQWLVQESLRLRRAQWLKRNPQRALARLLADPLAREHEWPLGFSDGLHFSFVCYPDLDGKGNRCCCLNSHGPRERLLRNRTCEHAYFPLAALLWPQRPARIDLAAPPWRLLQPPRLAYRRSMPRMLCNDMLACTGLPAPPCLHRPACTALPTATTAPTLCISAQHVSNALQRSADIVSPVPRL